MFYEAASFGRWETLMLLNPLGSILEQINKVVVLHQHPNEFWFIYAGITSIIMFLVGMVLSIKQKNHPLLKIFNMGKI